MPNIVLTKVRGYLALVGTSIHEHARQHLQNADHGLPAFNPAKPYHITVLTKDELRRADADEVSNLNLANTDHIYPIGLGGNHSGVYYIVVVWAEGQQLRKRLGLPPKDFHITLSDVDDHDMEKGVESLFPGQFPADPSPTMLDHLAFTLYVMGKHVASQTYSCLHILEAPETPKGFLRLADAALANSSFKVAMLAYAAAYERSADSKLQAYCIKKLIRCSQETEWGLVLQEHEIFQIPGQLAHLLVVAWSTDLRQALGETNITPTLSLAPREALYIPRHPPLAQRGHGETLDLEPFYKLPRFFRWLIPFRFAIMSTPRREEDIVALASSSLGIKKVLTLTEEEPLPEAWFRDHHTGISNTFLPIPNYQPPSIEQMDIAMRLHLDAENLPLLVHCGGGKGRTGSVAACYMVACGFKSPPSYDQTQPEYAAPDAISLLRTLRPGSIETSQQEAFIGKWSSTLWKRQSIFPEMPSEPPPCPLVIEKGASGLGATDGDLFMFVGLPGAGKSWVANSLMARDTGRWQHISQDESGSRALCETEIGRARRTATPKRVILDRCNMSAEDRKSWLSLAGTWSMAAVCVWFDYDRDLCLARAQTRADHPTLRPGTRVRNAIDQMDRMFQRPEVHEGFKAVVIIRSFAAAQEFVALLSPPVGICKFPRTPHLLNLGAATDDDIIQADATATLDRIQGHVVITEKIDGANMGFSLSREKEIVVQNRSHYVNTATHEQFRKLGAWVEHHREELLWLLDRDPHFPERYILYGEWLYATHSISYSRLPDYFVAFDFYDRSTGTFVSTKVLQSMLARTSIRAVPLMYEGAQVPSETELRAMVQRPSAFYEGRVEGVYVKVEKDGKVAFRSKIVRKDFIAGNEHWTRGPLQVNALEVPKH